MPWFIFFLLLALTAAAPAAVKLHPLFSDHMVLQRDRPVPVWGTAEPGESVTIEFAGKTSEATTRADGLGR